MIRNISLLAAVILTLIFTAPLVAGGPPWLCLPIDGVSPDSAYECGELLATKLKGKWREKAGRAQAVTLLQHAKQWYATFYMADDVRLSEVEAALQGSDFSIPRDRLRLFGHVVLEIEPASTSSEKLLADLKGLNQVTVAGPEKKGNGLLVTVDMPYPAGDDLQDGSVDWDSFRRSDFSTGPSDRSPVAADALPSVKKFRDLLARHKANLKDIRWREILACRPLGGVATPGQDSENTTPRISRKKQ